MLASISIQGLITTLAGVFAYIFIPAYVVIKACRFTRESVNSLYMHTATYG